MQRTGSALPPVAVAEHRRPGRKGPDEVRAKPGMASQSAGPGTARRVARPGREAQGTPDRSLSGATAPGVLSFRPFSLDEQRKGTRPSGAEPNGAADSAFNAKARHRDSANKKPGQTPFKNGVCPGFFRIANQRGCGVTASAVALCELPQSQRIEANEAVRVRLIVGAAVARDGAVPRPRRGTRAAGSPASAVAAPSRFAGRTVITDDAVAASCAQPSRCASFLNRSALRRMKPCASFWS